jgi:hypothetical protein
MAGLLFQGAGSLLFRLAPGLPAHSPLLVRGVFGIDFWHSWIHISWGAAGLAALRHWRSMQSAIRLALVFGVFYTMLGVAGVATRAPLGLELGAYENSFHLTAGPLTLALGLWTRLYHLANQRPIAIPPARPPTGGDDG